MYPYSRATTTLLVYEEEEGKKYEVALTVIHERSKDGSSWENRVVTFSGRGEDKTVVIVSLSEQCQQLMKELSFDLFNLLDAKEQGFIK